MPSITIPVNKGRIDDPRAIVRFLEPFRIHHERWPVNEHIAPDASAEEILAAYAPGIERLKRAGGYVTADVITVTPDTPGLEVLLERFNKEHYHSEDEVRFVIQGAGLFHIHPEAHPVFALQLEAGDLISVPAGMGHWFDLCADRSLRAIRLFQDPAGWTPHYLPNGVHGEYTPLCWGPQYVGAEAGVGHTPGERLIAFSGRGILLDIEGTTSSIAFVHQKLFPYARRELSRFLTAHWDEPAVTAAREQIARDAGAASYAEFCLRTPALTPAEALRREVERLMDADAKLTGLKQLQGLIWRGGYQSAALKSHVFPDVPPALATWAARDLDIRIYSSGSAEAQRLFFTHTEAGSLTHLLRGYYDTLTGPKREPASYRAIAADMQLSPQEVLSLSDVPAELDAARAAGLATGLVLRPGNTPAADAGHPVITDFGQIVISGVSR